MKKLFVMLVMFSLSLAVVSASGAFEKHDVKQFTKDVQKASQTKLNDMQIEIAEFCYAYYNTKFEKSFTRDQWNYAVEQSAKVCTSKPVELAMKTGKWGEKFIKAIIVQTEEAAGSVQSWVDKNAEKYDSKNK